MTKSEFITEQKEKYGAVYYDIICGIAELAFEHANCENEKLKNSTYNLQTENDSLRSDEINNSVLIDELRRANEKLRAEIVRVQVELADERSGDCDDTLAKHLMWENNRLADELRSVRSERDGLQEANIAFDNWITVFQAKLASARKVLESVSTLQLSNGIAESARVWLEENKE